MKRIVLFLMMTCLTALVCASVSNAKTGGDSCTREDLIKITDIYFESIQKHTTSGMPLASTAKFTENGVEKKVGTGFWETAGKPLLKRTLIDTQKCVTATIAVIEEPFSSKTVGEGFENGGVTGTPTASAGAEKPPANGL